jgi:hypothetical protein
MPTGIAIKLGPAPADRFQPGSAVYRLWPSLGMSETRDNHVVVAFSAATVDHLLPETTVFKSDEHGNTALYGGLDGGAEAIGPTQRIVGRCDPEAALANLAGSGYVVVDQEDLPDIEPAALLSAETFAKTELKLSEADARDYALNNWGMFAARHVVESGWYPNPVQSNNDLRWH